MMWRHMRRLMRVENYSSRMQQRKPTMPNAIDIFLRETKNSAYKKYCTLTRKDDTPNSDSYLPERRCISESQLEPQSTANQI